MFVEVEEQHAMKIDEIAWLKTAGTRSTVHVRLVAWHRQQQLVRFVFDCGLGFVYYFFYFYLVITNLIRLDF